MCRGHEKERESERSEAGSQARGGRSSDRESKRCVLDTSDIVDSFSVADEQEAHCCPTEEEWNRDDLEIM
jgi:hypothetical protein